MRCTQELPWQFCASVIDFSSYSIDARAEWSTMCQAPWLAQISEIMLSGSPTRGVCAGGGVCQLKCPRTHMSSVIVNVFSLIGR